MNPFTLSARDGSPGSKDVTYMGNHPESGSLSPIPNYLHDGLMAIAIISSFSFMLTLTLWGYLTYKLVLWRIRWRSRAIRVARNIPEPSLIPDLTFDEGAFGPQEQSAKTIHGRNVQQIRDVKKEGPNDFLLLIYNLLLADMHQAAAFLISAVWLNRGGIFVNTPACFVQGFFDSNGDLASSSFITFIATHTYMSVVKGHQPPQKHLYIAIAGIWIFVYSLSVLPVLITRNGADVGGYFVRAGGWCWISEAYEHLRLLTHYLFIFIALVTTSTLYIAIYIALRRQARDKATCPRNVELTHKPAFLIYPLIYVSCTLPLALGRIATMAGAKVPLGYYCFAGAMIASNGIFDCIIFGVTRHAIVFGSTEEVNAKNTGLDTFSFMRTPVNNFGNEVWIEGASRKKTNDPLRGVGGWWQSRGGRSKAADHLSLARSNSQKSLRGAHFQNDMAIHMDVVTTMTVDVARNLYSDPDPGDNSSVTGDDLSDIKPSRI